MKLLFRQQALLVLAALVIFFTWLGGYGLFNNGEATMAGGVAQMSLDGDWIVPTFNEVTETDHPILAYWFMLISFHVFGISEFAARLPSSVLALGTTLLTYHLGRRLYSSAVGFLAGVIVCTCLAFSAYGRAATPDSTEVFFETLSFASYVLVVAWQRGGNFNGMPGFDAPGKGVQATSLENGTEATPSVHAKFRLLVPATWQLASPMFVAMGLAVLATGLLGFGLPCATIFLFLLITLRSEDLSREALKTPSGQWWRRLVVAVSQVLRPRQIVETSRGLHLLIGIGIVFAIAAPWYLTVGAITKGAWLREFLWNHNVDRVIGHPAITVWLPLYLIYDPVVILGCYLPWAVFLPVAIYQLRERLTDTDAPWPDSDRLLACWLGVWAFHFLLLGTDLPNSVLPISPAVALILARYFHAWEREEGDSGAYSFNLCCKALGGVGAIMMVGFYIAAYLYFSGEEWIGLIGAVPLVGAYAAIKFLDTDHRRKVVQSLVVTAVVLAVLIVGLVPPRIGPYQDSPQFVADARRLAGSEDYEIGTYEYFEPSLVFHAGKKVRKLSTRRQVADFIAGRAHAFVITRADKHNELRDELQSDVRELSRHRNFLGRQELILLGRL